MLTIAILNAKGGSGKTTISTHLASYYAETKHKTALIDYDSQGSSTFWANNRPDSQAPIHCIPAYQFNIRHTRSFKMRTPAGTERIIIDTPAAITRHQLDDIVSRSDLIIIPVLPSSIDIHAVNGFIAQLQKLNPVRIGKTKIAVIANRVNSNERNTEDTQTFSALEAQLNAINIPFVTKIYDTLSDIHKLNEQNNNEKSNNILQNKQDWHPLVNWIEGKDCFPNTDPHLPFQQKPSHLAVIQAQLTQLDTDQTPASTSFQNNNACIETLKIEPKEAHITKLSFTSINTNKVISAKIDATDLKDLKTSSITGNKPEEITQAI